MWSGLELHRSPIIISNIFMVYILAHNVVLVDRWTHLKDERLVGDVAMQRSGKLLQLFYEHLC